MKSIPLWAIILFMFVSAIVFIPSAASVIVLLFAAVAVPLTQVQEFWRSKGLTGILKVILLIVLFAVSVGLAPVK